MALGLRLKRNERRSELVILFFNFSGNDINCPEKLVPAAIALPVTDGIMLTSKAQERDLVGNKVPENMVAAEERLELLIISCTGTVIDVWIATSSPSRPGIR